MQQNTVHIRGKNYNDKLSKTEMKISLTRSTRSQYIKYRKQKNKQINTRTKQNLKTGEKEFVVRFEKLVTWSSRSTN